VWGVEASTSDPGPSRAPWVAPSRVNGRRGFKPEGDRLTSGQIVLGVQPVPLLRRSQSEPVSAFSLAGAEEGGAMPGDADVAAA